MTMAGDFAVNGRFLTQSTTGVQRYAINVTEAIGQRLIPGRTSAPILAPTSARNLGLAGMPHTAFGPLSGHAWEQLVLPARWRGPLLNLCNTAPLSHGNQIVCMHDAQVFDAPESYGRAFRAFYRSLQPALARSCTLSTVSKYSAGRLALHLGVKASNILVLPNGHEHALAWNADAVDTERLEKIGVPATRPFLLAIGSRARHKNLQLLLRIAADLDRLGLDVVIAGGGAGIFAGADLSSAPNVRVIGTVSDDELAWLMERALGLVFPSLTEGFGLPLVEAMARGCPIISSDRASMPEVCGDAALLASPEEPSAWLKHARALLDSRDLRGELAARGHERVKLFSWAATAEGYHCAMTSMNSHPAPAPVRPVPVYPEKPQKVAVAIATLGRPDVVEVTVRHLLETQVRKPDVLVISCVNEADAGDAARLPGVKVVTGPKGLPAQRNTALAAMPHDTDVVVFFDDDFVADENWLLAAAQAFGKDPTLVGYTGDVIADGIKGPGLTFAEAVDIVSRAKDLRPEWTSIEPFSPYGCNMAFRYPAIGDLRFDERLVLYGWLEDRDFSAALKRNGGRLIKGSGSRGVHMGVKGGRVAGDRLGYSQIVNPVYMLRKGTMTPAQMADHIFRNVASNLVLSLRPEPFIDRRGRLRGNIRGVLDVARGILQPERAAMIDVSKNRWVRS